MHVAARARLVLARRPWIYWVVVAALALLVALGVNERIAAIDAARDGWGTTRTVAVATRQLEAGDRLVAHLVELPSAVVPDAALTEIAEGRRVRQRVAPGEVVTRVDVTARPGPASLAEPGTAVVAMSDPLARGIVTGIAVRVVADGLVLAERATVVDVVDEVIFVAVVDHDAPSVAAAARQGIASLLYLP